MGTQTNPVPPGEPSALRPLDRRRLYEQLVERLLHHVTEVDLRPGQRLPPERELAQRLGVSRASVRQALVALEVQGIVGVRHGDGTYLRRAGSARMPLRALLERRRRLPDILEAREALEIRLAELAAARRTDADLAAIEGALDSMADDIAAGGIGADAAVMFHRAVTAAAHNPVMAELMEHLAEPVEEKRLESLRQPRRPPESLAGHRRIAEAIRAGDPGAAVDAMRAHLEVVADVRLLRRDPAAAGGGEAGSPG